MIYRQSNVNITDTIKVWS